MTQNPEGPAVAEALRERASSFVNNHVDLWVTVDDDGTLELAADDAVALLRAAADWLEEDPDQSVADLRWERRSSRPGYTLRLALDGIAADPAPAPAAQPAPAADPAPVHLPEQRQLPGVE
ncbi:hypothetical protein GXW83_16665 [Streptacidiphilus sp. PB12-B1b]|uniref:hypothetical protein n=1 Tax=Streptacidiphilus sp. PB12-B1b TaxID=2705012 RepID=UPI0015F8872D|nr:hypothetical protein [Streptacidiphilus sp. PB12-B1b]QMU77099.1 hypothetical protein GXW83_16665 [Streptacidiphilus sp. PB12-B1b]